MTKYERKKESIERKRRAVSMLLTVILTGPSVVDLQKAREKRKRAR